MTVVGRLGVVLLDKVNEPVGGGVVRVDLVGAMQLRLDLLTQSLTQLNSEIDREREREIDNNGRNRIECHQKTHQSRQNRMSVKHFCVQFHRIKALCVICHRLHIIEELGFK